MNLRGARIAGRDLYSVHKPRRVRRAALVAGAVIALVIAVLAVLGFAVLGLAALLGAAAR